MTTNLLHGKSTDVRSVDATGGLAIGEADAAVFGCPACTRPLAAGTTRCPGCSVRLIGGIVARKAAALILAGTLAGLVIGGAAMAVISTVASGPRIADSPAPSAAPPAVRPTAAPGPVEVVGAPPAAISALSGTAVVNGRITVDSETLAAALARPSASSIEIARALRSLAADAALGMDLASRLGQWSDAATVQADLDLFYRSMAETARDAMRASLNDTSAYRTAGTEMMEVLAALGAVDDASRQLAGSVGLDLPPVIQPAGEGAGAS